MSIMNRVPMTNMECLQLTPDGKRCRFRTDDQRDMYTHQSHHEGGRKGVAWDNCQECGTPINLTKAGVLRVHGSPNKRCPGGGNVGTFAIYCRGETVERVEEWKARIAAAT